MSEPLAKERPAVDLDDFERRLRTDDHHHDPLAELARLVGETPDPYGDVFAQEAVAQPQHGYHPPYYDGRQEPAFAAPSHSPRLSGDFAAIEAGLRGALSAHSAGEPQDPAPTHEFYAQDQYPHPHDPAYLQDHEDQQWAAPPPPQAAKRSGARRPVYAIAATIAVGVIGVGVAFAYKGTSSSPSEIRTITAAAGPTKIQPPADPKDAGAKNPAILGNSNQAAPTQLVNREEQPVDISQAVQQNASRNADAGPAPGDASGVPVPPSPSQAANGEASGSSDPQSFGMTGMPAPKKVKVVSVRPDGTILSNDTPAAPAPSDAMPTITPQLATEMPPAAAPAPTAAPAEPAAKPVKTATPKSGSPKTTSRVAAKPAPVADDQGDGAPAAPAPKPAKKAKPVKVAAAEPATPDSEPTASLPGRATGGFAVQLAAPGSEADARAASSRLAKKFAAALDGRRLGFHKAQSNGKSVFRVRVGSLSREDAVSLCEKLKANGGSCFVAKNN